jgi:hypothetical protein
LKTNFLPRKEKLKGTFLQRLLLLMAFTISAVSTASSASRYAVASGNWNATSTWASTSGGSTGASVPVAGDNVYIAEGANAYTVTIPSGYSAACASISIGSISTSKAGVLNFTDNTSVLTISGNVTMNRPNAGATTTIGIGAGTMTVNGNVELSYHTSSATQSNKVNSITISSGSLTIGRDLIFGCEDNTSLQSQIVFSGAGTLNIGGNFTLTNSYGKLTPSTGTVVYNGSGAQTVACGSLVTYSNLTINKASGSATLSAAVSIPGTLTLQSGTLSTSGSNYSITVTGNWMNNGGTLSGGSSTVSFTGTTQAISGSGTTAFPALSIGNTAVITMSNNNSCSSLTFVAGTNTASLTHSGSSSLTVNGDVTINQPTGPVT